ncbi:proline iminopeptidase [Capsaspora owczarzaki ATCC 30864]|uniref:Proline iminopeptidase n=1 Tax=Capsaspora owczarzaki (strain ATCC 30864) TaxID=595528 RepID=A0A0D2X245_CAPO3|nr:proline iminopeptidase [Capsaspora owczarzaki ATCC 30864]KJE91919.1 proline iminopeptidase [Capsaspora owczarzaki ATCC 30864]|eukprot:XP_004363815.1 proline iminopeptidase [Capsaspora owczarzaki ATCC 30864]
MSSAAIPGSPRRAFYPPIHCYNEGTLEVSETHKLYYEQSGNPTGKPVVYLHGGPGGGTSAGDRCYFDPAVYRIVLFDQRGAGKSTPPACLEQNTTWDLVQDIEKLRTHLGIDKWVVFGGSWGSTLALAYAETHPDRVKALVLRGIFTLRRKELVFFYQEGADMIYADHFEKYKNEIPEGERGDLISAYYRRLTHPDKNVQMKAAKVWATWECATSKLFIDQEMLAKAENDDWAVKFARIECHYFVNGGFFNSDTYLLDNVDKIRHIPTTIVQGRYDIVCPMNTAWELHKRFPEADFHIVPDAGHSAKEPGITALLLEATDKYRDL